MIWDHAKKLWWYYVQYYDQDIQSESMGWIISDQVVAVHSSVARECDFARVHVWGWLFNTIPGKYSGRMNIPARTIDKKYDLTKQNQRCPQKESEYFFFLKSVTFTKRCPHHDMPPP